MQYNQETIWMSQIVDWGRKFIDRPILVGLVTVGWIPAALTLVAIDIEQASIQFLIGQFLACVAVMVAPFDVWYYDERLLPGFFEDVDDVISDTETEKLNILADQYDSLYSTYWWVSTVPWFILVFAVFVVGLDYFATQGIDTFVEQAAYFGFGLCWILIAGLRSHAVIVTLLAIRGFANQLELDIDPLHPDGLGGLSTVGNLSIQSTVIISSGSFSLPLAFQLAAHLRYEVVIYTGVGLFVFLVALNFLYPTYRVNRRAQTVRERELENRRQRIRELEKRLSVAGHVEGGDGTNDDIIQREIQRAHQDYRDYQNVTLYPLSVGIIIRLVSSVFLPIFFIFVDYLISLAL